jgi:hypothetical protein
LLSFVIIAVATGAAGICWLVIRVRSGREGAATEEPRRAVLSRSLFASITDGTRARASDDKVVVEPGPYLAVGSPRDAVIIRASRSFFDDDINKLIARHRVSRNLRTSGPIHIHRVIEDAGVKDGAPRLKPEAEARGGDSAIAGTLVPVGGKLRPITVTAPSLALGRNPEHGTGHIAVGTVSWEHARIEPAAATNGWVIADVDSKHGTFVNQQDVRRQPEGRVLVDGDDVRLGPDVRYTWRAHGTGYTPTG